MDDFIINVTNDDLIETMNDFLETVTQKVDDIIYKVIERFGITKENIKEYDRRLRIESYALHNTTFRYEVYLDNVMVAVVTFMSCRVYEERDMYKVTLAYHVEVNED